MRFFRAPRLKYAYAYLAAPLLSFILLTPGFADEKGEDRAPKTSASSDATAAKVRSWVANLGSTRFEEREIALAELIEAGKPAIGPLAEAVMSSDPEIAWRAATALEAIGLAGDEATLFEIKTRMEKTKGTPQRDLALVLSTLSSRWGQMQQTKAIAELGKLGATFPSGAPMIAGVSSDGGFSGSTVIYSGVMPAPPVMMSAETVVLDFAAPGSFDPLAPPAIKILEKSAEEAPAVDEKIATIIKEGERIEKILADVVDEKEEAGKEEKKAEAKSEIAASPSPVEGDGKTAEKVDDGIEGALTDRQIDLERIIDLRESAKVGRKARAGAEAEKETPDEKKAKAKEDEEFTIVDDEELRTYFPPLDIDASKKEMKEVAEKFKKAIEDDPSLKGKALRIKDGKVVPMSKEEAAEAEADRIKAREGADLIEEMIETPSAASEPKDVAGDEAIDSAVAPSVIEFSGAPPVATTTFLAPGSYGFSTAGVGFAAPGGLPVGYGGGGMIQLDEKWKGGDKGLSHLLALPSISTLEIQDAPISDKAIEIFAKMPGLTTIMIRGTKMTPDALIALREKKPNLTIRGQGRGVLGIISGDEKGECLVSTVRDNSPAQKVDIRVGDIITHLDGKKVGAFSNLTILMMHKEPGEEVAIKLKRGEETLEKKLKLGDREAILR